MSPDPDQYPVAGNEAEAADPAADARGPRLDDVFESVESEVALVHPEDGRRDGRAVRSRHRARQAVDGNRGCEPRPVVVPRTQPGREPGIRVVREGVEREDGVVGGAEALGEGRAQAAPHRVSDHQRTHEHRDGHGGGGGDQDVFAQVVPETAPGELDGPDGAGHA